MNRRGFLGSILALAAAPAIVRADSLMRIVPISAPIIPVETGITEAALVALLKKVWESGGEPEVIKCGPDVAQRLFGFSGVATRMDNHLSVYVSDYGTARIESDRQMPPKRLLVKSGFYHWTA